ncbi:MAG: YggS family pyridoxal phosphate-dependent enzyme [Rhodospirillaceae bacterium]|nr:YggS family pyridoxal phosphate-dependent enzyme [Rhodospirillaceae bacterium]
MNDSNNPRENLDAVFGDISRAARAAARPAAGVTLIAVSKTHGAEAITPFIAAGHRDFGENRIQEAQAKWPALKAGAPDLRLHLIGPLQSNKAADAVALFDVIHTVDREKIAQVLAAEMARQNRRLPCFIQVNTGREPQKAGIDPGEAESFVAACRDQWNLPVVGLMCIPPVEEQASVHFAFLKDLARRTGLSQLSMGMSADFETAVRFGATHVRVGSALFGPRETGRKKMETEGN